jgi:hypothetical protein
VTAALVLAALVVVAAVVIVSLPFLRDPDPASDVVGQPGADDLRRLRLAEERDRALAALQELEADHRARRISDEDYRASVGPLRREAAQALRAVDAEQDQPIRS